MIIVLRRFLSILEESEVMCYLRNTVEPLNSRHEGGNRHFVLFREVVLFSEVCMVDIGTSKCVLYLAFYETISVK